MSDQSYNSSPGIVKLRLLSLLVIYDRKTCQRHKINVYAFGNYVNQNKDIS